ncbi:MAG: phytanoyl-CoA dioxygenase family protein [candidate division Zixibacteria bacterium]|nr:phytanoyl-CoA dioxygenase family protein [candidate division Zixibacteria bacterium]
MAILEAKDRLFWEENGYVVIPEAVPSKHLAATRATIGDFLEIDSDDPETWYTDPARRFGFVEMYHHQALWNNRQHPRVYRTFAELWGEERLWVSFDRTNMTPPERPDRPHGFHEPPIHWDFNASLYPDQLFMQGVLYLTDTDENQGGFQCVPGFHRRFHEWVRTQPTDRDPGRPNLEGLTLKSVPGRAGDLIIWHSLLPHGNSRNQADRPRWSQYILMFPAKEDDEPLRQERIRMWQERMTPPGFPGDPRGWEKRNCPPADLTPLGRCLLGLDRWE